MTLDPIAQQVGVGGGVFLGALGLLLKYRPWEVHHPQQMNGSSGLKPVDYWKSEIHDSISEAIKQIMLPIMSSQTDILRELKDLQRDSQQALIKLVTMAEVGKRRGNDT